MLDSNVILIDGVSEMGPVFLPNQDRLGAIHAYHLFLESDFASAHQTIYQYPNQLSAKINFLLERTWFFPSGWTWERLDIEDTALSQVDNYLISCGYSDDPYLTNRCSAVIQSGVYINHLSSSIDDGIESIENFRYAVKEAARLHMLCERMGQ